MFPLLTILSLGTAAFVAAAPGAIAVPEGTRLNVGVRGGNWTKPDGTLLAKVLGGLGGEHGYIDPTGVFHLNVRYTVQFVQDNKWGYVEMKGFGILGVSNKAFITLESDSVAAEGLLEQTFTLPEIAPHWHLW
ncbi:hypothetical protein BS47DRAFT_1352699 [Hydnum rufescens UP504]|uniref:Uncharacterized protein n=1 Tax=Hydnum rufescens UP504 TaxID=1448309 RepID=A0A9P6DPK2_9AGAM|nr:hypothetical protein BS47DRAFT_1352699 [Hydnum rufescens UP504]